MPKPVNDTFDYIMRFAAVLLAYCCALLAAGWFLAAILMRTLGLDALMQDFAMMASDGEAGSLFAATGFWSGVFVGGFVLAMVAGSVSVLPAAVLILLAEARGYRSSVFYCVTGALIGLAAAGTIAPFRDGGGPDMALWAAAMAGAGIVGGFVYWALAGRKAGRLSRPTGE